MPRCLTVTRHLPADDLERRYRHCQNAVERSQRHMLWLVATGYHVPEVARLLCDPVTLVRAIIHRDNAESGGGIVDRRLMNPGHPPLLSPARREAMATPHPDGSGGIHPEALVCRHLLVLRRTRWCEIRPQAVWRPPAGRQGSASR